MLYPNAFNVSLCSFSVDADNTLSLLSCLSLLVLQVTYVHARFYPQDL